MTEWNTNVDEVPTCGFVWMTLKTGAVVLGRFPAYADIAVAWKEPDAPKPYREPCPEQISPDDPLLPHMKWWQIISEVERRTLEIVEWQLKSGSLETYLELKND